MLDAPEGTELIGFTRGRVRWSHWAHLPLNWNDYYCPEDLYLDMRFSGSPAEGPVFIFTDS